MIEFARARAEQECVPNARFERADAQVHPFPTASFDIVISRTGAMFFGRPAGRPDVAFANLARALCPGGRLTLLTWQSVARNEWIGAFARALTGQEPPVPSTGTPGPFSLGDPDHVRKLPEGAGFEDVELDGLAEPMAYGRSAEQAHSFVLGLFGGLLEGRPPAERERAVEALRATRRPTWGPTGCSASAASLVTARRSQRSGHRAARRSGHVPLGNA